MRHIGAVVIALVLVLFMVHNTLGYSIDSVSFDNGVRVNVELAETPMAQSRGLMEHENLDDSAGMLFIFSTEEEHSFWMKNMSFPIDIIWIDSNFKVVDITKNTPACIEDPCPSYVPKKPSKYVLEVSAGFSDKYAIDVGNGLTLEQSGSTQ